MSILALITGAMTRLMLINLKLYLHSDFFHSVQFLLQRRGLWQELLAIGGQQPGDRGSPGNGLESGALASTCQADSLLVSRDISAAGTERS